MRRKDFNGFTCDQLISLLDEHLQEGWSQSSFPSKINMTFSTFHTKKHTVPKFCEYYESKRVNLRRGLYKHGLNSFINGQG